MKRKTARDFGDVPETEKKNPKLGRAVERRMRHSEEPWEQRIELKGTKRLTGTLYSESGYLVFADPCYIKHTYGWFPVPRSRYGAKLRARKYPQLNDWDVFQDRMKGKRHAQLDFNPVMPGLGVAFDVSEGKEYSVYASFDKFGEERTDMLDTVYIIIDSELEGKERNMYWGEAAVDSGLMALFDPVFIDHDGMSKELNDYEELIDRIDDRKRFPHINLKFDEGVTGLGLVWGTMFGDGLYDVYARYVGGNLSRVTMYFQYESDIFELQEHQIRRKK